MTFNESARRFTCAITALCVLATSAATARPAAAHPAPAADMPGVSVFRATVQLAHPTDRARLNQLGVRVLAETADSAVVLADDLQLEALARLRFEPGNSSELGALATAQGQAWLVAGVKSVLSRASALQVDAGRNALDAVSVRAR